MTEDNTPTNVPGRGFRMAFVVAVLIVISIFVLFAVIRVMDPTTFPGLNTEVMQNHWVAVFGIPLSAVLALFVVLLTTTLTGEIKFEFGPIKISAAAGESVIWLIGFYLAVWAFKELWQLPR